MKYLLDESGCQQLVDLLPDGPALFLVESAQALLHMLGAGSDVQGVLGNFPRYARHFEGLHANTSAFARRKSTSTASNLGSRLELIINALPLEVLGVEEDELGFLRWLEAPSVMLGVGDVLVAVVETGQDRQRLSQSLSLLDALDVALVGVLARRADGDDAVWSRHLELEVGIVGDGHELGVAWSSQDCVVGPWEPDHVEGEDLPSEVVGGPKADREIDLPEGMGAMSQHHDVER